jgi:uncharacterized protein YbjT (DUF2867 family)
MKLVVTGSLGHIGRPLTELLVGRGHEVTVISRQSDRRGDIESLGAQAAIGTLEDENFLASTLRGADALFLLLAPGGAFTDPSLDIDTKFHRLGEVCARAIQAAGVTRLVYLSSVGVHLSSGIGLLRLHRHMEAFLDQLRGVSITFLRPTSFYTSLFNFLPQIRARGILAAGYGDDPMPWASVVDIAAAAAQELESLVSPGTIPGARKVRYVASEELTGGEIASILGKAIGKPELKWVVVPDEQIRQGMVAAGMTPAIVEAMVEMQATQRSGKISEDYFRDRPILGGHKLAEFAREFAAAYVQG